jgi:hypothetical protein
MAALMHLHWVARLLSLVPPPLHRALDAWSLRVARKRAEQRRTAASPAATSTPIDYKLKPWRD